MKKALSLILVLILSLSAMIVVPVTASAKTADPFDCITSTTAASNLATPRITKLQSTTSGVKITIGKVKGAVKYSYFIKSNKKWKLIASTKATSYVHKAVKSGKKYYYTVRCVTSNGKKFTSNYNKKGWYITYKKPANWRALYKSFILNKKYLKMKTKKLDFFDSSYFSGRYDNNNKFSLFDMNRDGIPELIALGGTAGYMVRMYHVYTIKNGKVVYLDTLGLSGDGIFLSTVSGYNGFFNYGGDEGYHTAVYVSMKGSKIIKDIVLYDYPNRTEVINKKLYQVMNKSRKDNSYIGYLTGKKPLYEYSYSQIKSMGWNKYIKKYGY